MKRSVLVLTSILVLFVFGASVLANSFGFEKNIKHRNSADAESVLGCMVSCQEMQAGWLEMNPDSKNYARQQKKIAAKAGQCLAMNELAGSPVTEQEILVSCGLETECHEVPPDFPINEGACLDILSIDKLGIPPCCPIEQTLHSCGVDQVWVIGIAAFPVCYIPG